jgi:predicted nucleotidyltransferase
MSKTALELTHEEWKQYKPGDAIAQRKWETDARLDERWKRAQQLAHTAATLLRDDFGAGKVILFGSLLQRSWFTPWSDIDLAVWGIPKERFFAAVAAVTALSTEFKIDLVDPEMCRPSLLKKITREGLEI